MAMFAPHTLSRVPTLLFTLGLLWAVAACTSDNPVGGDGGSNQNQNLNQNQNSPDAAPPDAPPLPLSSFLLSFCARLRAR